MPSDSAYQVSECVNIQNQTDAPGELYFAQSLNSPVPTPQVQEDAKKVLEHFAMVLRIAFQKQEPVLFREYFERLLSTAQAAFAPTGFFESPLNDLELFKTEVVQIAGSRIKSRYTFRLCLIVLKTSLAIALAGLLIQLLVVTMSIAAPANTQAAASLPKMAIFYGLLKWEADFSFAHTGLLLAGAMWGLLFASMTRNIDPTFDTLVTPDADLMEPWVRLLFFGIPALVISLLFQTELVSISFGERVSTSQINDNAVVAFLIGLLLGIAERALPKEVELWSKRILPNSQSSP